MMHGRGSEWSRGRGYKSRGRGRGLGYHDGTPDSKFRKFNFSDEVEEQVRELFQKKYQILNEQQNWALPPVPQLFSEPIYEIGDLTGLKKELNETKSQLDDKDIISWHRHTKFTNRAANIIPNVRRKFEPELCTQGWTKLHEILTTYNIIPHSVTRLNSLHLCEAPGAFITSLNHFLKTHRMDVVWQWRAATLNPYYEGNDLQALIDQDRFMMETLDHWYLGRDNSGDITILDNAMGLVELVQKEMKDVNLITADGSIDCSDNPAEQEQAVCQLLYCETFIALSVLREGGTFILKSFTTLECQSVCLLYLLSVCFREVNVFKPVTSKAGNSEQYIVCANYRGRSVLTDAYRAKLQQGFSTSFAMNALFPLSSLPESFLAKLILCTKKFAKYQTDAIQENIRLYICMKFSEKKLVTDVKEHCKDEYIDRCKVKKMPREKAILPSIHLDGIHGLHSITPSGVDPTSTLDRRSTDSLIDRMAKIHRPWAEVVKEKAPGNMSLDTMDTMPSPLEAARHVLGVLGCAGSSQTREGGGGSLPNAGTSIDITPDDVLWLRGHFSGRSIDKEDLKTLDGRKVEMVTNSRFCRNDPLKKLIEVTRKAEITRQNHMSEFAGIVSRCVPCHALLSCSPPYFLNNEGLNMAAVDTLTGVISELHVGIEQSVTFVDLWGAPSSYGQYVYWTKSDCNIRGWGVVRSERPSLRPSAALARLVQWDSFQILGSVQGLDITNNDTISSIIGAVEGELSSGGVQLVIGDLSSLPFGSHPPGYEEHHTKQQLLSQCICALKLLAMGGSFVCRVYSMLTRFSVGLLYLLYRLFREVALVKPITSSPASPEQFLVCKGFNGCQAVVSELLLVVNNHIFDLKKPQAYGSRASNTDVLELIPAHLLFDETFYRYVTQQNERMVKLQTQTILYLEKLHLDSKLLPRPEQQDVLKKGILELLQLPETLIY